MKTFYVSVGSNISPRVNIPKSLRLLKRQFRVKKLSSIYETPPAGPAGAAHFWNLAAKIETRLSKQKVREKLKRIEARLGRKKIRGDKYAPRTIDLDLFLPARDEKLAFVMIPLAEIAPGVKSPASKKTFAVIAGHLKSGTSGFRKIRIKKSGKPGEKTSRKA